MDDKEELLNKVKNRLSEKMRYENGFALARDDDHQVVDWKKIEQVIDQLKSDEL